MGWSGWWPEWSLVFSFLCSFNVFFEVLMCQIMCDHCYKDEWVTVCWVRRHTYEVISATKWAPKWGICSKGEYKCWESLEQFFYLAKKPIHMLLWSLCVPIYYSINLLEISTCLICTVTFYATWKIFITTKPEISIYATWSSKDTTDFMLLVFMISLSKERQEIETQKGWVFSHGTVCESAVKQAQALFYLFYLKYHSIFTLLFFS